VAALGYCDFAISGAAAHPRIRPGRGRLGIQSTSAVGRSLTTRRAQLQRAESARTHPLVLSGQASPSPRLAARVPLRSARVRSTSRAFHVRRLAEAKSENKTQRIDPWTGRCRDMRALRTTSANRTHPDTEIAQTEDARIPAGHRWKDVPAIGASTATHRTGGHEKPVLDPASGRECPRNKMAARTKASP